MWAGTTFVIFCILLFHVQADDIPSCDARVPKNGVTTLIGDTIYYSCQRGFMLEGPSSAKCEYVSQYGYHALCPCPICKPLPRCTLPDLHALQFSGDIFHPGDEITFSCDGGFTLTGPAVLKCESNGLWDKDFPSCTEIQKCNLPDFDDRTIQIKSCAASGCEVGNHLTFKCANGFEFEDKTTENKIICLENGTWNSKLPACKPIGIPTCPQLKNEHKVVIIFEKRKQSNVFLPNDRITLKCETNYHSTSKWFSLVCQSNGTWNREIPTCTALSPCPRPLLPQHGSISELNNITDEWFPNGFEVTYKCDDGYQLKSDVINSTCDNSKWNPAIQFDCIKITCLFPGPVANAEMKITGFDFGDTITYTCKGGSRLVGSRQRVCGKDGFWSGFPVSCEESHEEIVTTTTTPEPALSTETTTNIDINTVDGINIFFLFDLSGRISENDLNNAKEFAKAIIRKLGISTGTNEIVYGVAGFTAHPTLTISTDLSSIDIALSCIDKLQRRVRGGTNIKNAFVKLTGLIVDAKLIRPTSKSIVLLFTDGLITEGGTPRQEAKLLRSRYGTEIYSVGIGKNIDESLLREISTAYFPINSQKELFGIIKSDIGHKIDYSLCGLEQPNYLPSSSNPLVRSKRVVGGRKAFRPWPWMAAFEMDVQEDKHLKPDTNGVICGGFIIHNEWILSAAHCFMGRLMDNPRNWKVTLGRVNIKENGGSQFRIEKILKHPNFDQLSLNYDIALIKLQSPITFDDFLRPICLPPTYDELVKSNSSLYEAKQMVTLAGWGHIKAMTVNDSTTRSVDHLNEVEIPLQDKSLCRKEFSFTDCNGGRCRQKIAKPSEQMFCAGDGRGGKDACKGDGGGPLMQQVLSSSGNVKTERWFAIGITSWGIGCGEPGFYGYFTHVAKLRSWIESQCKVQLETILHF